MSLPETETNLTSACGSYRIFSQSFLVLTLLLICASVVITRIRPLLLFWWNHLSALLFWVPLSFFPDQMYPLFGNHGPTCSCTHVYLWLPLNHFAFFGHHSPHLSRSHAFPTCRDGIHDPVLSHSCIMGSCHWFQARHDPQGGSFRARRRALWQTLPGNACCNFCSSLRLRS